MAFAKAVQNAMTGNQMHGEGRLTEAVESVTAEVPSLAYLGIGAAAMGASLGLMLMGKKNAANFIGLWVPSILLMGLYNKVVKQLGSD